MIIDTDDIASNHMKYCIFINSSNAFIGKINNKTENKKT